MSESRTKILVVEDEDSMREILSMLLEGEGYQVDTASDGTEGLDLLAKDIYDLIITDIKMPGANGFELLKKAQEISPESLVIMITAFGTVESGIEAMKLGAYDYINKPFKVDEIRMIVRKAVDKRKLHSEVTLLRETVKAAHEIENIIGKSPVMQELLKMLPRVAGSDSNVLVTGESGTGKELVAAALHRLSSRQDKPFVPINCASFPEGLLESELFGHMKGAFTGAVQNKVGLWEAANNGTLFLDEIGEMSMSLQAKVLRAIENGTFHRVGGTTEITVDVRIVAATNRNLERAVEEGTFREDLYFRLNVIPLRVPPLRERQEDIPFLVEHFIKKYSSTKRQFSGSALKILMSCQWKGNVRELENLVERTLLFSDNDVITDADLPDDLRGVSQCTGNLPDIGEGIDMEKTLAEIEKRYLLDALKRTEGKKTEAASLLGLSFRSFRHKLSKYGIK